VDEDIANNLDSSTTIVKPDPNIDFRRVKNLKIFFDRNAIRLTSDFSDPGEWQPGDIVVFSNHIAICSDKRNSDGIPFLIHHNSHGAREVNEIENYTVVGHYRWPKNSDNDNAILGEYEFDNIIYLSPLSSSTIDYMEESMKGTEYIISKDTFEITSSVNSYIILEPIYEKKEMKEEMIRAFSNAELETIALDAYKEKYQYSIYDKDNNKINFYLYAMDGELWLASYVDNTANNAEIIMYIYKLK
jgi:hypothetical protein